MYIDEAVQAPDGREYTIRVFPAASIGPGLSPSPLFSIVLRNRWRVDVSGYPRQPTTKRWTKVTRSYDEAETLYFGLKAQLEAGTWQPANGDPQL